MEVDACSPIDLCVVILKVSKHLRFRSLCDIDELEVYLSRFLLQILAEDVRRLSDFILCDGVEWVLPSQKCRWRHDER